MDPVLAGGDAVFGGKLIGDEPVAEHWIIVVDLTGGVDQVGVIPVPSETGFLRHL